MKAERSKSAYVGLRMTEEQRRYLARLQDSFDLSKTDILLKGLELMGEYYSLGLDQRTVRDELRALEEEAIRYAGKIKQIKKREKAIQQVVSELREIDHIVDKHDRDKGRLIQILLEIQRKYHWLPKHALWWVSERLDIPMANIMQIASFYKVFSLEPKGEHIVRVCLGTACHVRGGDEILAAAERALDIKVGHTTPDYGFTLEAVNCLGCCALGPVMVVDEEYYGKLESSKVQMILEGYKRGEMDEAGIGEGPGESLEGDLV